ncbi:MAG TPA: 7TM diverse intracellular signaling domain-containing protein [Spirochaetia bacterium]|nr:7TM diverse intracellular signaling domain-containing protein [Spirochaetia bacterium]
MAFATLLLVSVIANRSEASAPDGHSLRPAVAGLIDLRSWDPGGPTVARLNGEWTFLWDVLADPAATAAAMRAGGVPGDATIFVPQSWRYYTIEGSPTPDMGRATYALRILLPNRDLPLFLHVSVISSAARIYANGTLVASRGRVGSSYEEELPDWSPEVLLLPAVGPELDLVIHVSNFHHDRGGIIRALELAGPAAAPYLREPSVAFELFLVGTLLVMGAYYTALFFLRRRDTAPLYFGVFCLIICLRTLVTGDTIYVLRILPGLSWELLQKAASLSFVAAVPVFCAFVRSLFPDVYPRLLLRIQSGIAALLGAVVVATQARLYTYLDVPYQVFTVLCVTFIAVAVLRASRRRSPGALVFLVGFGVLVATTVNDILFANDVIHTADLVGLGATFFILSEAFFLSRRMSGAFVLVERQAEELLGMNRAYAREIETRQATEARLRESQETARALLDVPSADAVLIDRDGIILSHNESFRVNQARHTSGSLTGACVWDLFPPDVADRRRTLVRSAVESGRLLRYEDESGGRWRDIVIHPVESPGGGVSRVAVLAVDITDRKRMEREAAEHQRRLVEADKLSSLGVLVAGVAHEVNNPNHAILLNARFLDRAAADIVSALDESPAAQPDTRFGGVEYPELRRRLPEALTLIRRGAERIDSIVSQLKAYARDDTAQPAENVDANEAVRSALALASLDVRRATDLLRVDLAPGLPPIRGHRQRLEQVIINLVQNAANALRSRDEAIEVSTRNDAARGLVSIHVRDEGMGMREEDVARIRDPFFTTRRSSGGTGLGLSVSASIVEQHGGSLEFHSVLGQGTEAIVRLPSAPSDAAPRTADA